MTSLHDQVKSKVKLYADDVLLYTTINSHADCLAHIRTGFRLVSEMG